MGQRSYLASFTIAVAALAQSINSGSTGSDGVLDLTAPGTVTFDPDTFTPALNAARNNIFQFVSIRVGKGVTVKLSSKFLNGPVFWLSQGPVQIDGTIDLNGGDGGKTPSTAGAGGHSGGTLQNEGYGPGNAFTPNVFLVPLAGGAGGSGGKTSGGGAGGGALLIASSNSITVNGAITANGGASADGTGGSGGSIRLVAPLISGSGVLSARSGQPGGADGRVRFEASEINFSGNLNETPFAQGKPFGLFLPPDPPPSVRLVSAAGAVIRGAELTVNQSSPVAVVVEARHIPPGTTVELQLFSEDGSNQTINTTPLEGTSDLSQASASLTLPPGISHFYVKADWKQPPIRPKER